MYQKKSRQTSLDGHSFARAGVTHLKDPLIWSIKSWWLGDPLSLESKWGTYALLTNGRFVSTNHPWCAIMEDIRADPQSAAMVPFKLFLVADAKSSMLFRVWCWKLFTAYMPYCTCYWFGLYLHFQIIYTLKNSVYEKIFIP